MQGVDFLRSPNAWLSRVDREHAVQRSVRACERHAEERAIARCEDRVGGEQALVARRVVDRNRRARLHDVAGEPGARSRTRTDRRIGALSPRRAYNQVLVLDRADRGRLRGQERGRLLDDLVEHGRRVQLGCERAAGPRELLRQRPLRPFRFEQVAALERTTRRVGQMTRELDVLVGELVRLVEEDEDEAARLCARACHRNCQQRTKTHRACEIEPFDVEAVVLEQLGRREDPVVCRGARKDARAVGKAVHERVVE